MRQNRRQSVCLRNAFKHYGSMKNPNHVLSNLNMTVAIGTIYGLLGASGCGKTTLLSCIVGRRRLNTGEIWVLGGKPGTKESGVPGARVGYMPQELALCPEFTIKETMMYFGCIFGMTTPEISDRLQFLIKLLVLPTQKCMVKNLSAGQQRRVSLAVALMHEPELLILDEPTVGVDPLLRQSIWDHLVRITRPGDKTVIITTHYIEEARQAHTIGMMRSGRLLAEEAPQALLTKYGRLLLEDVFLELSRTQGDENQVVELNDDGALRLEQLPAREEHVEELEDIQGVEPLIAHINGVSKGSFTSSGKLKALIKKNFWCMHRNIGLVVFCIGLPIIQSILFCIAIGPDPTGLQLAIVNMDTEIVDGYCPYNNTCSMKNLSCRYLAHLNNGSYIMEYFANLDDALDSVRKGDSWGAIYFNENYTDSLVNRLFLGGIAEVASVGVGHMSKAETFDLSVMKEFINSSEVKVWLDMSNQQIGLKINKDVLVSYRDFQKDLMIKCGSDPKLGDIPIDFQYPIYGNFNPSFTNFVAPGVILTIVFFLAVAQTSAALILERTEGLLDRSLVAGVTNMEIFFCHVVTQFLVMILQTALVLFIMIVVFKVECKGNHGYVIMLTVLQGLCGMGYGFAISAACVKERTSIEITLGSYYPTLLLSGIIWPIEGMPMALRYISKFLPLTLATTSLRAILSRGWSITEFDVYIGFIGTVVWIIIFLVIIITIIKCKRE